MCGRVRLPEDYSEIKIQLHYDHFYPAPNFKPSWNIAPTQPILTAVRDRETGKRQPALMRWGLIPWWAKDEKLGVSTFNARADTIDRKPAFRDAWRDGKRCLVVTDGFNGTSARAVNSPTRSPAPQANSRLWPGSGMNGRRRRRSASRAVPSSRPSRTS
jgi:putative SOS response-associated peptidase YedK